MSSTYVKWGSSTVKLTWKRADNPPHKDNITSAHGFCFHEGKLLMVDLHDRGWDFPGGHLEAQESTEKCFKREAMEEGYVKGSTTYLGYIEVNHSEDPNWNEHSRYPKIGYQAFYRMDITDILPFKQEHESINRLFINPREVEHYYRDWNVVYESILEDALKVNV